MCQRHGRRRKPSVNVENAVVCRLLRCSNLAPSIPARRLISPLPQLSDHGIESFHRFYVTPDQPSFVSKYTRTKEALRYRSRVCESSPGSLRGSKLRCEMWGIASSTWRTPWLPYYRRPRLTLWPPLKRSRHLLPYWQLLRAAMARDLANAGPHTTCAAIQITSSFDLSNSLRI
ncbi:hypothetical protein BOTBODRAFT_428399 [Botryobasidium botryosum FD-172 SS1]|uniref:Uncharacterized protein n=1 Tax=Botryobasidium botryosum (strain FD-172 SS1) TaxID=930990 RepID=A0A067MJD8_BOTB1|nr:hypothetical protein BOTBODRAFT_428399 [Botryobasidium botryosum FD-172 SS1]